MQLKRYQEDTLDALRAFLGDARRSDPALAYARALQDPERARRLGRFANGYRPLDGLPDVPYACLRVPTGGGKTLLAAHAIGVARDCWIERDYPLVLWLAPTDMIRRQTLAALNDRRHLYRKSLDADFNGRVRVFDIADFTMMRPHDLRDNCCIIVGTIQTLRVTSTEGRKVYKHNEDLEPHFALLTRNLPGYELHPKGGPKYSFANLMHALRPLMIVDEAHNAVTGLTREMQARVNPCAIVEFTATPRFNSNLLYSVTGWELKEAEMIKLPIRLTEHRNDWRSAVAAARAERERLAEKARADKDFIRPIVLLQAQPANREVTVEALRKHLEENEGLAPQKIKVATGDQRELEGVDLFAPDCEVEYVITVEALKEGWDCSFAYVLCSVASVNSEVSVEQLLGRVLRMPYVKRRVDPDLNRAYAHLSEPNFRAAAESIAKSLETMGFEEQDARQLIENEQYELDENGLFAPRAEPPPVFSAPAPLASVAALRALKDDRVSVDVRDGEAVLQVKGYLPPELVREIAAALPEAVREGFNEAAASYQAQAHPRLPAATRGESFVAPALMAFVQGEFVFAEPETIAVAFEWSPRACDAALTPQDYMPGETSELFEIDLVGARLSLSRLSDQDLMVLDPPNPAFANVNFATWLEDRLRDPYLKAQDVRDYVLRALAHLVEDRAIPMPVLWDGKYRLLEALRGKLARQRAQARTDAHQYLLLAPEARVAVSHAEGFRFHDRMFETARLQPPGRWRFQKHFLGPDRVPALDGAADGEEVKCALAIDALDEVEFWVRNVSQHSDAFRLPLASKNFYPDFIAKLHDGRVFVVEYKGHGYVDSDDSREKRAIGAVWEKAGGGLFLMVEKMKHGLDMRQQLEAKLSAIT